MNYGYLSENPEKSKIREGQRALSKAIFSTAPSLFNIIL